MSKRNLTGLEKAAIFVATVGPDAAAEILKNLEPKEVAIISNLIAQMGDIQPEEVDSVMDEFSMLYKVTRGMPNTGEKYMRSILERSLGKEQADKILEMMNDQEGSSLQSLKWMDPKAIANLIRSEHPQTVALILSYLNPNQASAVLGYLPELLRADVIFRMATLDDVNPQVLRDLEEVLSTEMQILGASRSSGESSRVEKVANLLNEMDRSSAEVVLDYVSQNDQTLAEQIRSLMFVFDDLLLVDNRGIQGVLQAIPREALTKALRGSSEQIKEKFLSNMSTRAQTALREDMESMGGIPLREVESAQAEILKIVRKLEGEGKLVIAGRGGEKIV
ncbi:MAG: flagellar motor switch protein FliG [Leptospirales bacterium]